MNFPRLINRLGLAALLLAPLAAWAAPDQPIEVSADTGRFEQEAGSGLYRGDVELVQGKRQLQADEMRLFTDNGELVRVEAEGKPVRMEEGADLNAHANKLVYDVKKRTLVLTGDAFIRHRGNTFEGAKVEYSLDSKRVDASADGDKRVRLVIPAEKQSGATEKPGPDATPPSADGTDTHDDDNTANPDSHPETIPEPTTP